MTNGKVLSPSSVCGNPRCGVSICIDDTTLTFGSGRLDHYGFWSKPCKTCADEHHVRTGEPTWPGNARPFKQS